MAQAVILAGGKGKRLAPLTDKIPKPMIKIGGLPLLEHQIKLLKKCGVKEILILTGHLSEVIEKFISQKSFGIKVKCVKSNADIGNAERLKTAEKFLKKDFFLLYGDIVLDVDLKRLLSFHQKKSGAICTLVVHPTDHPHDSDLIEINNNQQVIAFRCKPRRKNKYFRNLANSGIYVVSPKIFRYIKPRKGVELDITKNVIFKIFKKEKVFAYNTPEYARDMGTVKRLKQLRKDYASGKIARLNLKNKRRAIFLDRDATINREAGDLWNINDFRLLPGAAEAIKLINLSEYLAIVITNQPVVAKGFLTLAELRQIHNKMETLLGQRGAKLDGIYYCPHYADRGFPEENPRYTIQCDCRKPQTGLVKKAEKEFNVDLKESYFIGDSVRDVLCGKNAGTKTIALTSSNDYGKNRADTLKRRARKPDYMAKNLYSAVKLILKQK